MPSSGCTYAHGFSGRGVAHTHDGAEGARTVGEVDEAGVLTVRSESRA